MSELAATASVLAGVQGQVIQHHLCLEALLRKCGQRRETPEFEDSDNTPFLYACDVLLPLPGLSHKASKGEPGADLPWQDPVAQDVPALGDESPAVPILPQSPFLLCLPGQPFRLGEWFGGQGVLFVVSALLWNLFGGWEVVCQVTQRLP